MKKPEYAYIVEQCVHPIFGGWSIIGVYNDSNGSKEMAEMVMRDETNKKNVVRLRKEPAQGAAIKYAWLGEI